MTTRQRSAGPRAAAAKPEDTDDVGDAAGAAPDVAEDRDNVVGIHDGPVDLDLDVESHDRDHIPPMTVKIGGEVFTIEPPDAKTVMDIEEAPNTRAVLALVFDDDWSRARPLIDDLDDPRKLNTLARQHARHFEIDEQAMKALATEPGSNRKARRARRRASGRS